MGCRYRHVDNIRLHVSISVLGYTSGCVFPIFFAFSLYLADVLAFSWALARNVSISIYSLDAKLDFWP